MNILITGSSGLIGSKAVRFFDQMGFDITGVDNNLRADFFGPKGDTTWNRLNLEATCKGFTHLDQNIRDRAGIDRQSIKSTFGTIRHWTKRSKSCLTCNGMLHMMFKLG